VEWTGIEIHPDTPPRGRPLTELFRQADIDRMMEHLRVMGAPFGITFVDRPFLSNSRPALIAAELAREQDRFQPVHEAIFSAYFSQGLDIGDLDTLCGIMQKAGLDAAALENAVRNSTYASRLQQAQKDAAEAGVTGVPTFLVEGKGTIVGAQPLDVFRKALGRRSGGSGQARGPGRSS
jgi:predicted DsbA family dithiol-disulfide isomerase